MTDAPFEGRPSARLRRSAPFAGQSGEGDTRPSTTQAPSLRAPSDKPISVPVVDPQVIHYLRMVFPNKFDRSMDHRQMDMMVGRQEVIEHLIALHEEQQKG